MLTNVKDTMCGGYKLFTNNIKHIGMFSGAVSVLILAYMLVFVGAYAGSVDNWIASASHLKMQLNHLLGVDASVGMISGSMDHVAHSTGMLQQITGLKVSSLGDALQFVVMLLMPFFYLYIAKIVMRFPLLLAEGKNSLKDAFAWDCGQYLNVLLMHVLVGVLMLVLNIVIGLVPGIPDVDMVKGFVWLMVLLPIFAGACYTALSSGDHSHAFCGAVKSWPCHALACIAIALVYWVVGFIYVEVVALIPFNLGVEVLNMLIEYTVAIMLFIGLLLLPYLQLRNCGTCKK